jgi:transcriptional regulator GlxA family with amidase domain
MTMNIGFLLYPNVQPLDVIGPWEVFSSWRNLLNGPVELSMVAEHGGEIACDNSVSLRAHVSYEEAPQYDVLVIPGGRGRRAETENRNTIEFLAMQASNADYVLSICTGAFLVNAASLGAGQKATTYWRALPEFTAATKAEVVEKRIVISGKYWFSGGITSGIDLALEFISHMENRDTAGQVQLLLEYFPSSNFCTARTLSTIPSNETYPHNDETHLPKYVVIPD